MVDIYKFGIYNSGCHCVGPSDIDHLFQIGDRKWWPFMQWIRYWDVCMYAIVSLAIEGASKQRTFLWWVEAITKSFAYGSWHTQRERERGGSCTLITPLFKSHI